MTKRKWRIFVAATTQVFLSPLGFIERQGYKTKQIAKNLEEKYQS